jgi:hypothetical protein
MLISRVLDRIAKCNSVGVEFNVALAIAIIGNFKVGQIALNTQRVAGRRVEVVAHQLILMGSLTPELTGAGGPIGPQGTNIGHQNREAMANVGVRVERFVRLGSVGRIWQIHFK